MDASSAQKFICSDNFGSGKQKNKAEEFGATFNRTRSGSDVADVNLLGIFYISHVASAPGSVAGSVECRTLEICSIAPCFTRMATVYAVKCLSVLRVFHYNGADNRLEQLDEQGLLDTTLTSDVKNRLPLGKTKSFVWLDIAAPTKAELDFLAQRFALDPQIMEDLRSQEGRPKIHDYKGYIYIIFHSVELDYDEHQHLEVDTLEIDCLVGPDWIVTVHPRPVASFEDLIVRWERRPDWMKNGAGHLLYELMDSVLDAYFPVLERINERIDEFEDMLYEATSGRGEDEPLSSEIFALKRGLLQMRHIADPTRDVVTVLQRRDSEAGGRQSAAFQDLHDHVSRIVGTIDTYREVLTGALDVYLAIESNRMNAVMKRLTSYSIILLLPTLIAGIYGMNFDDLPKNHGFYGSLGAMSLIVIVLLVFFKRRGWL